MENKRIRSRYVEGSAARQLQPAPERRRVEKPQRELSQAARKNREKAMQVSRGYAFFLMAATIALVSVCFLYLRLHADISATTNNIAQLTDSVETIKAQNDAVDYNINSYTDINHIIQVATQELGMIQAAKGQVSYYKSSESEFMKQFTDVPEE